MGANWTRAAACGELRDGDVVGVRLGLKDIAIYRIDGNFYATDDTCTHAAARLSDGWLEGGTIECPVHGGRFEVKTGKGLGPPITCDLRIYPSRIVDGNIEVDLGD